ncbi:MAG: hypothetical protein GY845_15160, partial [Planctomycetes bacterium]|nr:hypothetical protein [Planctomycetota bacterium]
HLAAKGGRDSGGICLPAGPRAVAVLVLHVVGDDAGGGVRTAPGDVKVGGLAVGGGGLRYLQRCRARKPCVAFTLFCYPRDSTCRRD